MPKTPEGRKCIWKLDAADQPFRLFVDRLDEVADWETGESGDDVPTIARPDDDEETVH